MAAYNNSQTEEEKRLAAEQAARLAAEQAANNASARQSSSPLEETPAFQAHQQAVNAKTGDALSQAWDATKTWAYNQAMPVSAFKQSETARIANAPLNIEQYKYPQQNPLSFPNSVSGPTSANTSELVPSPSKITQSALGRVTQPPSVSVIGGPIDITSRYQQGNTGPLTATDQSPTTTRTSPITQPNIGDPGGMPYILGPADYPKGWNQSRIDAWQNQQNPNGVINNSYPPEVQAALDAKQKEVEAKGGRIWTAEDSNRMILGQSASRRENDRLDALASQGLGPDQLNKLDIETAKLKQKTANDYAGLAQSRQEFEATQYKDVRDNIIKNVITTTGSITPALNIAYSRPDISNEQLSYLSGLATPEDQQLELQKIIEANQRERSKTKNKPQGNPLTSNEVPDVTDSPFDFAGDQSRLDAANRKDSKLRQNKGLAWFTEFLKKKEDQTARV